jgi:acyl-CoA synthetase (AMP-forming)/AMP-acid ligase II/acyl carrier protein
VHVKLIAEAQELFDDLNIKTVLLLPGDGKIKEVLKEASTDLNIVEIHVNHTISSDTPAPPVNVDNGIALYLHTSGTTGKPKAVPLRHSNLIRGAKNVAETYDLSSKDRTYLLQVLFHIHGIIAALLAPLITGGSIVIPMGGKLNASCAWSDFTNQKCNWVTGTPSILQTLLAAPADPVPGIRFIRSCSSPLLPTVFNALRERFSCPIIEAYAMTEASHQMCSNRLDLFASGTVGPESGTTKVCIWDGGKQACHLGQEGEVSVCGENVMGGYEGVSPEKNKEAFWHGTDERGYEAKWFRTGDRGVLSTDGHRRLTLIGRLSEMVNRGGEKISPVEVDEAMMLVADDVKEAASFSVPEEFYGQEIEAAVVLKDGSKMDEASLQGLLESRLAKFKIPKRIHFCEGAIPKGTACVTQTRCKKNICANVSSLGPTGKIQRKNLTQKFAIDATTAPTGRKSADIDIYGIIDRALSLPPGEAEKNSKATLLELGADSLGLAKIVSSLKRTHGRQLDMATMFSFPSVDTVVEMARQGTGSNQHHHDDMTKPAAFSLLPNGKEDLQAMCDRAGVKSTDVEDAFPLSSSQKMYFDIFLGDHKDTDMMWQINRYKMAKGTEPERLVRALNALHKHEESLRWTLAEDAKLGWVTLQLLPDADSCIEELECANDDEARRFVDSRLDSCHHRPGIRTATIFVIKIGLELEMTFLESHGFTEGQGRAQMLETLHQAYKDEAMDLYPSYANFIQRYPAGSDPQNKLDFWKKEDAAMKHSEGPDWKVKQKVLENPHELTKDRLDLLGGVRSVKAPFNKLAVQTGMTIPFIAEAVYALSLALYFGQQDQAFLRGSVVYDRCISLRTADPQFSGVRAVTGGYHPNSILLALAHSSLWYVQLPSLL